MHGFGGYKTADTGSVPDAVTVMDPFHVVALAGTKLDLCRQRVQQETCGHRGWAGDPLYRTRRTLRTREVLLSDRQKARLAAAFAEPTHTPVQVTWSVCQRLITAYAHPDPKQGHRILARLIETIRTGVPAGLAELAQLGRTLHRRRSDLLAYFTHRCRWCRVCSSKRCSPAGELTSPSPQQVWCITPTQGRRADSTGRRNTVSWSRV